MTRSTMGTDGTGLGGPLDDVFALPDRAWLDLHGLSYLQLPIPEGT